MFDYHKTGFVLSAVGAIFTTYSFLRSNPELFSVPVFSQSVEGVAQVSSVSVELQGVAIVVLAIGLIVLYTTRG